MAGDNQSTAERGRRLVADALRERGAQVTEVRHGNIVYLEARNPAGIARVRIRVKTRTGGTWQGSINDGHPDPSDSQPKTFWVFVDISRSVARPGFYVVPDSWMRRDIHEAHQRYLRRHGGVRALTADSTHHAIELSRIEEWRSRWDLLEI